VYWGLYGLTKINPSIATVLLKLLRHLSTYKCRSKPRLLWTVMNANNGQVQIYKHGWMNIRTLWKAAIPCWFQWTYKFDYYGVWSVTIVHVLSLPVQAVQGTWENVFSEKNTEQTPDRVTILNVVWVYVCSYKHL